MKLPDLPDELWGKILRSCAIRTSCGMEDVRALLPMRSVNRQFGRSVPVAIKAWYLTSLDNLHNIARSFPTAERLTLEPAEPQVLTAKDVGDMAPWSSSLQQVDFRNVTLASDVLGELMQRFPRVLDVSMLDNRAIDDAGVLKLLDRPLTHLGVYFYYGDGGVLSDVVLERAAAVTSLESLRFEQAGELTTGGIRFLSALTNLSALHMSGR